MPRRDRLERTAGHQLTVAEAVATPGLGARQRPQKLTDAAPGGTGVSEARPPSEDSRAAERLRGTGHPQEKVMASAAFLAQHLAEAPAIVIPTSIGRHDGSGRPGLFDSVM